MLKVSLLIQATERVTAPVRRIGLAIRRMARDGERDVSRVGRSLDRLRSIASRAGAGIASGLRRGFAGVTALARRAMSGVGNIMRRGFQIGAVGAIGGLSYLLYRLTFGAIQAASQFEQFQVILENTEGSARAAQRAMAWVRNFAARTPYELAEVMEAFNQLRLMDFSPTTGSLEAIGNAASAMGRPLIEAIEAVQSAVSGEYEPLRRFGVSTSKAGNMLTFTYTRNGREFRTQIRENRAEIERAMTSIFNQRFPNMMRRQATTLQGLLSTISDAWTDFQLRIANAGFFDFIKGRIQQLLNKINELAANGRMQEWAQSISDWLVRTGTAISEFNWRGFAADVSSIASAFASMARAVGSVLGPLQRVIDLGSSIPGLRWLTDNAALPAVTLPRNVFEFVNGVRERAGARDRARADAVRAGRRGPTTPNPRALVPGLPGPGRWPGRQPLRFMPSGAPLRAAPTSAARQPRAQADIHLRIDAPQSLRPTVTRLSSDSRDFVVDVRRGRVATG